MRLPLTRLIIGYAGDGEESLHALESSLAPRAVVPVTRHDAERLARTGTLAALYVEADPVIHAHAWLGSFSARRPFVSIVAVVPPRADAAVCSFELAAAGAGAVITHDELASRERIRHSLARAGDFTVARALHAVASPSVPMLAPVLVSRAVGLIAKLKRASLLADVLGVSLYRLRTELMIAQLFPPKHVLAWLRLLAAARLLTDTDDSTERVGLRVGYASGTAFRNACRLMLQSTPGSIRDGGGLAFAAECLATTLVGWRAGRAGTALPVVK